MTEHRLLRTPEDKQKKKKKKMGTRPPRTTPRRWTEQQQQQQHHRHHHPPPPKPSAADDRSRHSDSTAGKNSTPSSVLINGHSLTRDLSDLSGSYYAATASNPNKKIPRNVYPNEGGAAAAASKQKPWRKARVLSSRRPQHPQPPADCGDSFSFGVRKRHQQEVLLTNSAEGDGDIETTMLQRTTEAISANSGSSSTTSSSSMLYSPALMLASDSALSDADSRQQHHCRSPLLLLLMDPGRKIYELMHLWVDVSTDTVRDVLHAIQQSLGESRWRLDYDGLFQVRNNHFSQLIHILNISKYDVQPYELWVAKPWSMAAKHTVGYAGELLNHLKQLGVLTYYKAAMGNNSNKKKNSHNKSFGSSSSSSSSNNNNNNNLLPPKPPADGDACLVLSPEAKSRIYVPEGILKHHHACQFLTFSPPFESQIVDVLSDQVIVVDDGSTSQLSESQLGYGLSSVSFEDNGSLAASSVNNNNNLNGNNSSNNKDSNPMVILSNSTLSLPPGQESADNDSSDTANDVDVILGSLSSLQQTLFGRAAAPTTTRPRAAAATTTTTKPPTPPLITKTTTSPPPETSPLDRSSPEAAAAAATMIRVHSEQSTTTTDDTKKQTSDGSVYWDDYNDLSPADFDISPGYCHMEGTTGTSSVHNKIQQQRQALLRAIRSLNCVVGCRPKHGHHYKQKKNKYLKTPTSTKQLQQQHQDTSETIMMESPSSPQSSPEAFLWHVWEDTILEVGEEQESASSSSYCNRSIVSESAPLLLGRIQSSDI